MTVKLSAAQKRFLRQQAHHLNPIVRIGDQGLHAGLLAELDQTLEAHELTKLRITGADREEKRALISEVEEKMGCVCIQTIGHVAVLYRPAAEPVLHLPG